MKTSSTNSKTGQEIRIGRLLIKSVIIFLIINIFFVIAFPVNLGKLSIYNTIVPGRERLPFGEDSEHSYNLSVFNLKAMFSSHIISGEKKSADEYRVILIGDSSVWGILLHPEETLSGAINFSKADHCGLKIRSYNLGYPTISITKDLLLLNYAVKYQPDLIVWPVTLEAFPAQKQLSSPIVANNAETMDGIIREYNLPLDPNSPDLIKSDFWKKTLFGQRRELADYFRLQMYGFLWAATGIDQVYPVDYQRAQVDLEADKSFHDFVYPNLDENRLAFPEMEAGINATGSDNVLLVNEPILISNGANSDVRYNFYYPRWAYDQYRNLLNDKVLNGGWNYLDLWDLLPAKYFSNSAIHINSAGETLMAQKILDYISGIPCQ